MKNGYILAVQSDGTVKAIYVRDGRFENLTSHHNTQQAVDALMSYDELIYIGDTSYTADNQIGDSTCYCNKSKLREPKYYDNKAVAWREMESEVLINTCWIWEMGKWYKIR